MIADEHLFDPRRDLAEAVARLRKLAGIGEWTAQYIAMRALGESDAFLAADVGLQRSFATIGQRPTAQEAAGSRRAMAAVARVRHVASVDGRCRSRPSFIDKGDLRCTYGLNNIRRPFHRCCSSRMTRVLCALEFADHEPRMHRLLREHYGDYELEDGAAPASIIRALDAYFDGDLTALDDVRTATGGTSVPACRMASASGD